MKLNYKVLGEGKPLVILHGLFGTLDNWITAAKLLVEKGHKVYLLDQRNHGKSPHSDEFSYEAMASDLLEFLDDQHLQQPILMGHSMGGKTVMRFAVNHPTRVAKIIVVDIAPKLYLPHHQTILAAFHSVNLAAITTRKEAEECMMPFISNVGVRQFLLKNLDRVDGASFQWKMNLPVIEKNIEMVGQALGEGVFEGKAYFIGGGSSDYIQRGDRALIIQHFPKAKIASIKDAGHWVHAEKPEQFMDVLIAMLNE